MSRSQSESPIRTTAETQALVNKLAQESSINSFTAILRIANDQPNYCTARISYWLAAGGAVFALVSEGRGYPTQAFVAAVIAVGCVGHALYVRRFDQMYAQSLRDLDESVLNAIERIALDLGRGFPELSTVDRGLLKLALRRRPRKPDVLVAILRAPTKRKEPLPDI